MDIPIVRFMRWLEQRRSLCMHCHAAPRQMIDGTDLFCSPECARDAAVEQALSA